jgi:hypothetical protein
MERFDSVKANRTLTPALSHPMGEGESFAVSFEFVSAGFGGRVLEDHETLACCPPLPSDGRGVRGEGFSEIK